MSRARIGQEVFQDKDDFLSFLELLPESCTNYLLRLEAPRYDTWCKIQVLNGERLTEIAEEFNLTGYSSVSNAHRRIKAKLRKNYRFRKRYGKTLENLTG